MALYSPTTIETLVFNTTLTHAHFYRDGYDEVGVVVVNLSSATSGPGVRRVGRCQGRELLCGAVLGSANDLGRGGRV